MESKEQKEEVKEDKTEEPIEKNEKYKIMKNKSKNTLLNQISYIIYNKNNFEEKIKPSELEIKLELDSDNSTYKQLNYKTKLSYSSFNPKRDLLKNIEIYKSFPAEIETKDEYYSNESTNIIVDFYPRIKKGIILDLSIFPFYSYDGKTLNKNVQEEIKNNLKCKENEYILCLYLSQWDLTKEIIETFENIIEIDSFEKYFKNILVIIETEDEKSFNKIISYDYLQKYLNKYNDEKKDKNNLMFLFNFLSNYDKKNKKNKNNYINIFHEFIDYFFILDNNETIVKIKPIKNIGKIITFLLLKFKENKRNSDISFFKNKETIKKEKYKEAKKLIHFISNIQKLNLNYIFDIKFRISFTLNTNDELTQLKIKKINKMFMEGLFFTKEYNYLKQICDSIKLSSCEFYLTEMKTIDIEVDFTDKNCQKCKKIIGEEDFMYYCYICKVKYCYECVQNHLNNNSGKAKYIDAKHNLLFFKTRDKNQFLNLEERKLGKNLFADASEDNLNSWSSTTCNGCKESIRNRKERYVCLHCRKGKKLNGGYVDFCAFCIKAMCEDKKEMRNLERGADEVMDNWRNDFMQGFKFKIEHKHENHVYLMMPYSVYSSEGNEYYFF